MQIHAEVLESIRQSGVDFSPANMGSFLFSERNSVSAISVIYVVVSCGNLLYVGKTRNMCQRMSSHHRRREFGDSGATVCWYQFPESSLSDLESECIRSLSPQLNGTGTAESIFAVRLLTDRDHENLFWLMSHLGTSSKSHALRVLLEDYRSQVPGDKLSSPIIGELSDIEIRLGRINHVLTLLSE